MTNLLQGDGVCTLTSTKSPLPRTQSYMCNIPGSSDECQLGSCGVPATLHEGLRNTCASCSCYGYTERGLIKHLIIFDLH